MLKASALYIVIIISLVIAVLCSSLITTAYFYRTQYQQQFRSSLLNDNLYSGINILLASNDSVFRQEKRISLFGSDHDSVSLQKISWGVFTVGIAKAYIQKDTIYKTFMMGHSIDSSKWAALYVADEDRPLSAGGTTHITGDAFLPKSGIQAAYVNNNPYTGDKRIVLGKKRLSEKDIPGLDSIAVFRLADNFKLQGNSSIQHDSVNRSFLSPTKVYSFGKVAYELKHLDLAGNIIICSDTTVVIDSTARLDNILVFAKAIEVKSGFSGKCQLFATDSISVGQRSHFHYPSCLAVIRVTSSGMQSQEKIALAENCVFSGTLFTYEKKETPVKPLIGIGKKDTLNGQAYSQGITQLNDESVIRGNVFTKTFLYRTSFTKYENYLINVTLDPLSLSPYYLCSGITPVSSKKQKILQWLEGN